MNKYIPDYLEEFSEAFQTFNEALKEVCKKLDLITDAIYGEEETDVTETAEIADNNEDLVVPDITLPEILPAKQVKLPNEDNEEPTQDENADDKQTSAPKKRGRKPKE